MKPSQNMKTYLRLKKPEQRFGLGGRGLIRLNKGGLPVPLPKPVVACPESAGPPKSEKKRCPKRHQNLIAFPNGFGPQNGSKMAPKSASRTTKITPKSLSKTHMQTDMQKHIKIIICCSIFHISQSIKSLKTIGFLLVFEI